MCFLYALSIEHIKSTFFQYLKIGLECLLLSVPNFSPIGDRIRVLWRILQNVRKEEEKNEEKNPNFGQSYLGNGWSYFLQIWNVGSPT